MLNNMGAVHIYATYLRKHHTWYCCERQKNNTVKKLFFWIKFIKTQDKNTSIISFCLRCYN